MTGCKLGTANDQEALADEVARAMWATVHSSDPHDEWKEWDQAGPYWQMLMRQYAAATIRTLREQWHT